MELIWVRASGLVRRGWRATVLLAIIAGLAGGVAMAMVAAGRRTATVYDRFAAYADVPELLGNFCPPDFVADSEASLVRCYTYDARRERDIIAALPEVDVAARGEFRGLTVAPAADPDDTTVASALVILDPGIVGSPSGRYLVPEGRDARAGDEVVLNETLADRARVGVGDEVVITYWGEDDLGRFGEDGTSFSGPTIHASVVGIGRALTDLAAAQVGFGADEATILFTSYEHAALTASATGFTGVLIDAAGEDAAAATAAIDRALPDQDYNIAPALGDDEIEPTREAIRYEAQATSILGLIVGLVVVAFIGQAVARQSQREWSDGPVLRAIGITTRDAGAAAVLRGAAIGLPAALLAVGTAILLSPLGPVGVGRKAEVDPGIRVDGPVLVGGGLAVLAVGALGAWSPLVRGRALRALAPPSPRTRARRSLGLPPVAQAGLHLARGSGRGAGVEVGTALASAGAAVIAIVGAACLTASFDDLAATPARFGAPWDASVSASLDGTDAAEELLSDPSLKRSIDQAAVITGFDLEIGDETAWVHAFVPLPALADDVVPLPISAGRPPRNTREIAVGEVTLRHLGLSIGDPVPVTAITTGERFDMTIVGTTIVNDTFEASPGRGGVVTPGFIDEAAPEVTGDPVILSLTAGTDVEAFVADARARHDGIVDGPIQQAAVRNVGRIRNLPVVMAGIVAMLALVSLVHALVLSVRRNRRVLGVLKGLGFTRLQIGGTVAWHATSYAVTALVLALPLGVIVGRWSWRLVARSLGVPAVPVVPLLALALVLVSLVALANLAAAYPAWRAARLSTAAALRTE